MNDTPTAAADAVFLGFFCAFTVYLVSLAMHVWGQQSRPRRSVSDPITAEALAKLSPEGVLALLAGPAARRRCACGRYGQPADGSFTLIVVDDGERYRHTKEQCCPAREHILGPAEPCSCGGHRLAGDQLFLSWDPRNGCVRHRTSICEPAADSDWDDSDWDDEDEDF